MNLRYLHFALLTAFVVPLSFSVAYAQRGKVIRPATTNVMDPNADGFISKTPSGFSNDGYYVDEFELKMFGIPKLGGDVAGDNIGANCGITDLIPDNKGFSVYAVRDANDNLVFRFRVGDDNASVEAWTILLDADGLMGSDDPNATAENPGFEIDITLIKRNNQGVLVYNIDGRDDCPSPLLFYDIDSNFQISIADEVSCGDPDYFYDFYVPFAEIAAAFNIDINTGLRYVSVTNVSATCAMGGNISDISGIDNNDPAYSGCDACAFQDLVNNQCPTPIADLCETCAGFEKDKVSAPIIDEPIRAGQTIITGSTIESDIFIRLQVFTNTAPDGSPPTWGTVPREEKGVYSVGNIWTVTLANPLLAFDKIVAIAQKDELTVPCGANDDNSSSTSVTVVSPNTPPIALDQAVDVTEEISKQITLTGTDPENDPLIYSIVGLPSNGTLNGNPPNVTYTPNTDYFGPDSFTFSVDDGIFSSVSPGTITINVTPVNDTPVANNLNVTTAEDTPVATTLIASDVDGDPLVFTLLTQPLNGILTGTLPNLTYTPNTNYFGDDNFTFNVSDGQEDSNTATVSITITPVGDDAPQADAQDVTTPEDTPVGITLTGSDPDFDELTYVIISAPANGTLTGTGPDIAYKPNRNYSGSDSFTFRVNDGTLDSPPATVTITVTPVNDAPLAFSQTVPYDLNTPVGVTLTGADADGDALTFTVTVTPSNGILSGTAPNLTYTPDTGYTGDDTFKFIINDGTVDSEEATISLNLNPLSNVPPVASDGNITTQEDTPVEIGLTANDSNGDNLTYTITVSPSHGTLSVSGAIVNYSPDKDYNGQDTFKFEASDASFTSNEATVTITVAPVNDLPIANAQSVITEENTPVDIILTGSDPEGDAIAFAIANQPAHGSVSITGAAVTYTPSPDYSGTDNFAFTVNDGDLNSAAASVSILINPNGSPFAVDKIVSTDEDMPVDVDLSTLVADPEGDVISHSVVVQPKHGTIAVNGTIVTYIPDANYYGRDTLSFQGNDGNSDSNLGKIFITVLLVNDPPVAHDQSLAIDEDDAAAVVLTATDIDSDTFSYTILTLPQHGTLTGSDAGLIYTPAKNYSGTDDFTFQVNDGYDDSNIATVGITVNPLNDAPVISQLTALPPTKEDSLLRVCLNVVDVDGDEITFSDPSNTKGGGAMVRDVAPYDFCYIFTPAENYNGESTWNFQVVDSKGLSGSSPANILVLPVNDAPVALDEYATISANSQLSFNVVTNDLPIAAPFQEFYDIYEGDSSDVLNITNIISGPFHGSASVDAEKQTILYAPESFTFMGSDSVKYEVCDSGNPALCATAVLFIDVTDNDFAFKIYEGVSPNNDGQNDYLHIEGIHRYNRNLVRIFDRFNNMVWEASDYDNEGKRWDGQSNHGFGSGRLPEGTYYYTVYLEDNGELFSGYVILKEN